MQINSRFFYIFNWLSSNFYGNGEKNNRQRIVYSMAAIVAIEAYPLHKCKFGSSFGFPMNSDYERHLSQRVEPFLGAVVHYCSRRRRLSFLPATPFQTVVRWGIRIPHAHLLHSPSPPPLLHAVAVTTGPR